MRDLGTLGGCEAEGAAIKDGGQVIGSSITVGCDPTTRQAFSWTRETGMRDLGTPLGTLSGGPGALKFSVRWWARLVRYPVSLRSLFTPFFGAKLRGSWI